MVTRLIKLSFEISKGIFFINIVKCKINKIFYEERGKVYEPYITIKASTLYSKSEKMEILIWIKWGETHVILSISRWKLFEEIAEWEIWIVYIDKLIKKELYKNEK